MSVVIAPTIENAEKLTEFFGRMTNRQDLPDGEKLKALKGLFENIEHVASGLESDGQGAAASRMLSRVRQDAQLSGIALNAL